MRLYCGSSDNVIFDTKTRTAVAIAMYHFRRQFAIYHGYIAATICVFSIVTNFIHIVVLTRKSMRHSSVNYILTVVAFCDLGTMTSYLAYLFYYVLMPNDHCSIGRSYEWVIFAMVHVFLSVFLHSASVWLLIALAFMRLFSLRQMLFNSPWKKAGRAIKISFAIIVIIFLLTLPLLPLQKIVEGKVNITNCNGYPEQNGTAVYYYVHLSEAARANGCQMLKASLLITGLIFKVFPCILLGIVSILLMRKVHERKIIRRGLHHRRAGHHTRPNHERTTMMLVIILLIFLITELPQGLVAIGSSIFTEEVYFYIYGGIADVLDLLSLINSSVNFLLYCIMSSSYREVFRQLIRSITCKAQTSLNQNNRQYGTLRRVRTSDPLPMSDDGGIILPMITYDCPPIFL